ncbi:MAG: ferredoxin [Candidatus Aenigmarchaeota archaeon]|nr:ferredoxin [Candidatus Aenigmarchaeota archaeon]
MPEWKIEHDRPNCIGCGACAAVCPASWTMSPDDGKSDLVGAREKKEGGEIVLEELEFDDIKCNKEAAETCPVNVIHIIDLKTGEKVI